MTATILIVDDEPAIRHMLAFTVGGNGYSCFEAGNVDEAHEALNTLTPDVILLDWMLPGISGVDFARRLKRDPKSRSIPIIMLTAKVGETDKIRGLDSGADDYITKPFSTQELLARIRAVLRRTHRPSEDDVVETGVIRIEGAAHRVSIANQPVDLSPTEFRLLRFFVANPERVYTRGQLLDGVWGSEAYIEERTVDVHIRRLRKLLEPLGCADYIQTVRSVGYRFSSGVR